MPDAERKWLTVWVRDMALAFPLERVREVMLWIPCQPAPPDRTGLVGVLPVRGDTWPVWDLALRWGWESRRPSPETGYILVDRLDGDLLGAFLVDRTGWVIEAEANKIQEGSDPGLDAGCAEYLFQYTATDPETGHEHFVFDVDDSLERVESS